MVENRDLRNAIPQIASGLRETSVFGQRTIADYAYVP